MVNQSSIREQLSTEIQEIYNVLDTVLDPEVPVLTVVDLGIIRNVRKENGTIQVDICPTYSGCPALDVIAIDIKFALDQAGFTNSKVNYILDQPWTTDWISEDGKKKLKEYGIAPPQGSPDKGQLGEMDKTIICPICDSKNTEMISAFGSTACKSLYRCKDCLEPFDYFKCK